MTDGNPFSGIMTFFGHCGAGLVLAVLLVVLFHLGKHDLDLVWHLAGLALATVVFLVLPYVADLWSLAFDNHPPWDTPRLSWDTMWSGMKVQLTTAAVSLSLWCGRGSFG
jgi:Na+-driven multidrug efflux pump